MPLSDDELLQLSTLLDEVFELDDAERAEWFDALDRRLPHIAFRVRQLLSREADAQHTPFLATLPKLTALHSESDSGQSPPTLTAGDVIGPYRLLQEIGRGGMSSVWSAVRVDAQIKRLVALKLPHAQMSHSRFTERFIRERDILATLTHPHIARLYDAGVSAEGQPYLAMEFVDGLPLTDYCDKNRSPIPARIDLFIQVLGAVQFAHANLVIHRDLKPSNILVTAGGSVQLLDFGIAKLLTEGETKDTLLTQFGGRALTPEYASPEQIAGRPLTTASDVYSLGVLLYELMTASRPYRPARNTPAGLEEAILNSDPQLPSQCRFDAAAADSRATTPAKLRRALSGDLDTIILKSLRKSPEERYATPDAFRQDIERYLAGHAIEAKQDTLWYRSRKFLVRNRVAVAGAAIIMSSLITGLAIALWQAGVARQQARIAKEQAHTAQATQTFIENIFRANSRNQPDPVTARKTTARELLDVGAAQIDSALNDTPDAKLDILRTLSNMYDDLGLTDKMMEIEQKHLDIARRTYGKDDPRLALSLTMFGNVAERVDLHAASEPAYLEAEGILDRIHDFKSFPRAVLETNLGFFYYSTDLAKALYHADKGVIAYRSSPPSSHLANALVGESYIYNALGDYANAKKTAEEALTVVNSIGAAGNDQLGEIYEGLGFANSGLEEIQTAEANFKRSRDIAMAGLGDVVFEQLEAAGPLGDFLVTTSRVSEGLKVLQEAHDLALTLTGARAASSRPARTLMRHGAALITVGRLEEGMKSLDLAETITMRQGQDPMIELDAQVLDARAMGFLDLGDLASAEQLLTRADAYHRQSGELKTPNNNRNAAAHVRLLMLSGRETEAAKALEEYWVGTSLPVAARPRLELLVLQAELALAQGNLDASSSGAAKALALILGSPNRPYLKIWELRASLVKGKSKLLAGEPHEAQPLLYVAVDIAEQILDRDRSPILADARIALAESCLDLGQRGRAVQLRASAQEIQATHRMLGDQYIKPLRHLKARLDAHRH